MDKKLSVAVLTGGNAAELEVSLKSAQVVVNNLDKQKFDVYKVDITHRPWQAFDTENKCYTVDLNNFSINNQAFDVVFLAIHGNPAENGKLQGYFDVLNIPYAGCSVLASAITFDKDVCKSILANTPIAMAKSVLLNQKDEYSLVQERLKLPLFVKPNKNGSSYGVSKVKDFKDLPEALATAFNYDDEVLVEEFIDGRELANGVFQVGDELTVLPITEVISENEFFDYEAKYQGKSKEITPAPLTDEQTKRCQGLSEMIYQALKLEGAARIDYFLVGDEFYLLEVNTIPGLSEESILPQQVRASGLKLSQFFAMLILDAYRKKTI